MSNKDLLERMTDAKKVFLPNRYKEPFVTAYQQITGIEVPEIEGRSLSVDSQGVRFRLARGRDIPRIIEIVARSKKAEDIVGLTGSEWYEEYAADPRTTNLDYCQITERKMGTISLLVPPSCSTDCIEARLERSFNPVGVVTAYPNLVRLLGAVGNCNIAPEVTVSGAIESVADELGMPAVDLVCKGETAKQNGFSIARELLAVYPVMVAAKAES